MSLSVHDLVAGYGSGQVIDGVDLEVVPGEILVVAGRNGMGKTTLLETIMGQTRILKGEIAIDDRRIDKEPSHRIARSGLGYVPQGRRLFRDFTVLDNLRLGGISALGKTSPPFDASAYFPILKERQHQKAGSLSGGEQQQLAIGRALAGNPRYLLLDEPSEGVQPSIVDVIGTQLRRLADRHKIGVLLVEQQLDLAVAIADRIAVMEKGRIERLFGSNEVKNDQQQLLEQLAI